VGSGGSLILGLGNTLTTRGTAALSGTLIVSGTGTLGNYRLLAYTSKTGAFANTTGLDPNYGLYFNPSGRNGCAPQSAGGRNYGRRSESGDYHRRPDRSDRRYFQRGTVAIRRAEHDGIGQRDWLSIKHFRQLGSNQQRQLHDAQRLQQFVADAG